MRVHFIETFILFDFGKNTTVIFAYSLYFSFRGALISIDEMSSIIGQLYLKVVNYGISNGKIRGKYTHFCLKTLKKSFYFGGQRSSQETN